MINLTFHSKWVIWARFTRALLAPIFVLVTAQMVGQTNETALPSATLNAQGILQIPSDQELMEVYEFSLASLTFPSDEALVEFFSNKSSEFFIIRPNTGDLKGIIYLKLYDQPEWTVDDWNAHLALVCSEHPIKQ